MKEEDKKEDYKGEGGQNRQNISLASLSISGGGRRKGGRIKKEEETKK